MKKLLCYIFVGILLGTSLKAQIVQMPDHPDDKVVLFLFENGFAHVVDHGKPYYMNEAGQKFETLPSNDVRLGDREAIDKYKNERKEGPDLLPKSVLEYRTEKGIGVLSPEGDVILEANYEQVETQYRSFWRLYKEGKFAYFLPDSTLTPFFEDIGYLDGEYFDVRQDSTWHLYSKSQKKIVTKGTYEGFDYCGGCGNRSPYLYAKKDGKWGIIDWNEKELLSFDYDHFHQNMRSDNWVASFSKNGEQLVIHIPTKKEFRDAMVFMGLAVVKQDGKLGAYDSLARLIIPFEYDDIEVPNDNSFNYGYSGSYLLTDKQHKIGVMDLAGKAIIPNEYNGIRIFGDYFIGRKNNNSYLLDQHNKVIFQVSNGHIEPMDEFFYTPMGKEWLPIFRVKQKAYYGLYFADTKKYIEPQYYAVNYEGSALLAEKNQVYTLYDLKGNPVLENCTEIKDMDIPEQYVRFTKEGKTGIYDLKAGKEVIPAIYNRYDLRKLGNTQVIQAYRNADTNDAFSEDRIYYHYYSMEGKKLLTADIMRSDSIAPSYEVLTLKGMGYGVLNTENMQYAPLPYKHVYACGSPDLLLVSQDDSTARLYAIRSKKELDGTYNLHYIKTGYLPTTVSKDPVIFAFSEGLALIYDGKQYGYLNEEEKTIIKPQYDKALAFKNGAAMVANLDKDNSMYGVYSVGISVYKAGWIDRSGKLIFPMDYSMDDRTLNEVKTFQVGSTLILPKYEGLRQYYGLGDLKTAKVIVPPVCESIKPMGEDRFMLVQWKDKFGVANDKGEIVVPVEYEDIMTAQDVYYNWQGTEREELFPLLVRSEGKWRYIRKDGTYLPIIGDLIMR